MAICLIVVCVSVLAEFSNVQREKVRVVEHSYAVIDCMPPIYNPGTFLLGAN